MYYSKNLSLVTLLLCKTPFIESKLSDLETVKNEAEVVLLPSDKTALHKARALNVPIASATLNAEFEHADFWEENGDTLRSAWKDFCGEIACSQNDDLSLSDVIDPNLFHAVDAMHTNTTLSNEDRVRLHFKETGPSGKGQAYQTKLLSLEGLRVVRDEMDKATSSKIPLRRPNGMNRHGFIIDEKVDGANSLLTLTDFIQNLIDDIGRPAGRMLFADSVGGEDDIEYFAFTIRYNAEEDLELKEHRDASVVTLNINLNLPEENYDGSSLYLLDEDSGTREYITFEPGMMLIHRGSLRHATLPITEGTRYNLVVWLFGEGGSVRISPYADGERLNLEQRWERPDSKTKRVGNGNNTFFV